MIRCHFYRLIGGTYDIRTVGRRRKKVHLDLTPAFCYVHPMESSQVGLDQGSPSSHCGEFGPDSSLPFVVLAGESPIDQLTDGACFTQVIQQDHQWDIPNSCFPVYLVGQVGEIELQILK